MPAVRLRLCVAEGLEAAERGVSAVCAVVAGPGAGQGPAVSFRVWRADDVVWGWTYCEAPRCMGAAELLADFEEFPERGVPVCLDDADLLLERAAALDLLPGAPLPELWEGFRAPTRLSGLSDLELDGRSPEKWLDEQGWNR